MATRSDAPKRDPWTYDAFEHRLPPLPANPPTRTAALDGERLARQLDRVRDLMLDGHWRTLAEISQAAHGPEASISARLRELRRPQHGGYTVQRRRRGEPRLGLWEYRLALEVR